MNPSSFAQPEAPVSAGVSVVIPTYNYANFLGTAITSVLRQDHLNFELLVVDDGSTDATAEVVAKYADARVRYLRQANAGLSAARNTGIREARHEFVAFLDADDFWLPSHLSAALAHFARLGPSFGLVTSHHFYIDSEDREIAARPNAIQPEREIPVADVVLKTRFNPSSVVMRRAIFAECGGFDTTLRSSEDRDMWIRAGCRHRIFMQGTATVRIRKHGGNMSRQADRMRASMKLVIRRAYDAGVISRWHFPFWLKAWAIFLFQSAWLLHEEGRRREAVCKSLAAICIWPWPMAASALNVPPLFRLRALARFAGLLARTR